MVGNWYVMHRSESNLDENGLCSVKHFKVADDGTLSVKTSE